MTLFVPGKKTKPGTAGLTMAERRSRRRNARSEESSTAPPEAPSTIQDLLAEREQLYHSIHTAQNVQARAVALTEALEQRFATERKSLEEEISVLKHRETTLTEEQQALKNNLSQEIEKHEWTREEITQLKILLQEKQNEHEQTKQNLQANLDEECCKTAKLGKEIEEMQQKLHSFHNLVDTLQQRNKQLEDEVDSHRKQISALQSENSKLQEDLVSEQRAYAETQEQCKQWQSRFTDAEANSESAITEVRKKLEKQEALDADICKVNDKLRKQIASLLKEAESKQKRIDELEMMTKSSKEEQKRNPESQEMSDLLATVASRRPDLSTKQDQSDDSRNNMQRGRNLDTNKRSSECLHENKKRSHSASKIHDSGFHFESLLVDSKRLSFSPSLKSQGDSSFHFRDFLVDTTKSKSRKLIKKSPTRQSKNSGDPLDELVTGNNLFSVNSVQHESVIDNRSPADRFGILIRKRQKRRKTSSNSPEMQKTSRRQSRIPPSTNSDDLRIEII